MDEPSERDRRLHHGAILRGLARCPHCGVDGPRMHRRWSEATVGRRRRSPRRWGAYQCVECGGILLAAGPPGETDINAPIEALLPADQDLSGGPPRMAPGAGMEPEAGPRLDPLLSGYTSRRRGRTPTMKEALYELLDTLERLGERPEFDQWLRGHHACQEETASKLRAILERGDAD